MAANLEKKTLNFREGDWDYLESIFYSQGIGPSVAIRTLVSNFVDAKRAQERSKADPEARLNIQL